jgi:hypothetical protein
VPAPQPAAAAATASANQTRAFIGSSSLGAAFAAMLACYSGSAGALWRR